MVARDVERPRAVTVIGWVWLALAAISLFRSLADLIVWKMIRPAIPGLLQVNPEGLTQDRFLRPLFEHFVAVKTVQAIAAVAVGFSAFQLLRLRPWARVVLQTVCGIALAYVVCFATFWIVIWTRTSGRAPTSPVSPAFSNRAIALLGGLGICAALAAGLVAMIALLRSSRVRESFGAPPRGTELH